MSERKKRKKQTVTTELNYQIERKERVEKRIETPETQRRAL